MPQETLRYVTTNLFTGKASDFGGWAGLTPNHTNLIFHQLVLVSSGVLATGIYAIRIGVFDGIDQLENTADTTKTLDMTNRNSALAFFTGAIRGVQLLVDTAFAAGETISCVLTSSSEQIR